MVNSILYGITNAIKSAFDEVPIYIDTVEQGLTDPCFFVLPISASEGRLLSLRAYREVVFDVHYISDAGRLKLESVASQLYLVLRQITLLDGSMLNGFDLKHEIEGDALHFFVKYKPTVLYESDSAEPSLSTLELNAGLKNEEKN